MPETTMEQRRKLTHEEFVQEWARKTLDNASSWNFDSARWCAERLSESPELAGRVVLLEEKVKRLEALVSSLTNLRRRKG